MTPSDEMRGLIERIEGASGPDRELDCLIALAVAGYFTLPPKWEGGPIGYGYRDKEGTEIHPGHGGDQLVKRYTASLDAAMTLVPEGAFPKIERLATAWLASVRSHHWADERSVEFDAYAATPALALCAASLRALSTIEGYDEAALRCARRTMAGPSLCALPAEHAVLSHRQAAPPTQPRKALNMEATPEMIAMAERIARQASDQHSLAMTYAVAKTAALAAFIETTELAAKHAEKERGYFMPQIEIGPKIAAAYRNLDHLKGPDNAQ